MLPGLDRLPHSLVADGQVGGEPFNVLRKTASQIVLESVTNARKMLQSGFTTVRDVGTYRALNDIALRDAIARGDIIRTPHVRGGCVHHDHRRRRAL